VPPGYPEFTFSETSERSIVKELLVLKYFIKVSQDLSSQNEKDSERDIETEQRTGIIQSFIVYCCFFYKIPERRPLKGKIRIETAA